MNHRHVLILAAVAVASLTLPAWSGGASTGTPVVSQEHLMTFLEGLTAIQPYSGWRSSATEGEAEALDYVAEALGRLTYLQDLGLELERQSFHVFLATELWETRLYLTVAGGETEVPADGIRGHRHDVVQSLRSDSDGVLNDSDQDPAVVDGEVMAIPSLSALDALNAADVRGRIAFLNYALIDPALVSLADGIRIVTGLINDGITGLVLITQFTDKPNESNGRYLGEGMVFKHIVSEEAPPTLYARMEDLSGAGITSWSELEQVTAARLVWDADVFSPGTSGNLVARIPGVDPTRAVILGAHIDSPNCPGAIDNGISSAALFEVARAINEAQIQPEADVYLAWFGSEELWLYGSQVFVDTHQELLDRAIGVLSIDAIIESTDEILILDGRSHSRFGDDRLPFPEYVVDVAAAHGITIDAVEDYQTIGSDNGVFGGHAPQSGFAFGSEMGRYAHSPYDTMDVVRGLGDLMERAATVALLAALETGEDAPQLRVTPAPDRRAVIVASHTEVVHMGSSTLVELSRALAWEGFDVDAIPYGQTVTDVALADADLVVVLPVVDYPSPDGDPTLYDEAWLDEEIETLVAYVENGGLLVLTNSANRLLFGWTFDPNEDWRDINALAERFGVVYSAGELPVQSLRVQRDHPLMSSQSIFSAIDGNSVPFAMEAGQILAGSATQPTIGLVEVGNDGGQVLVLADAGMLGYSGLVPTDRDNFGFLRDLAAYARQRGV